ncbi:archease [Candidatus Micrarchaeota archaeon]|nr:archease [Candidatus Micrarchaeota archaeon]
MGFKFIEGLTMADVAFEAKGKTLEETFESAANALMATQVQDLKKIEPKKESKFKIKGEDVERLLANFLQELIFLKDAKLMLYVSYNLKIEKAKGGTYSLAAKCKGEKLDMKKHELLVDVKAVSWHLFKVEKTKSGWTALVILDV